MSSNSTKPGEIDIRSIAPHKNAAAARAAEERAALGKIDGRTLRRTGRDTVLSVKTTKDIISTIQGLAQAEGTSMVDIVERGVELVRKQVRGVK